MEKLQLPSFSYKFQKRETEIYIWDIIRRKYIVLKPEEWVRQHFIHFLINRNYPKTLISIEKVLIYNKLKKRPDILVYSRNGKPFLLVECKAPYVPITEKIFYQITTYNLVVKVPYLCITNGMKHYYYHVKSEDRKSNFLNDLPKFK